MSREDDVMRRIRERREARVRGELTGLSLSLSVVPSLAPRADRTAGGAGAATIPGPKTRGQENESRRVSDEGRRSDTRAQDRLSLEEKEEEQKKQHFGDVVDEDEDETLEQLPPAPSPPVAQKQADRKKVLAEEEVPREAAPPSPPTRRGPALRGPPRTAVADRAAKTGSAPAQSVEWGGTESPQGTWRKSPNFADRSNATRIADLGAARKKVAETASASSSQIEDDLRPRGMTDELDGFMGGLGMAKTKKTTSQVQQQQQQLVDFGQRFAEKSATNHRTASGGYKPVSSAANQDALLLDLARDISSLVHEKQELPSRSFAPREAPKGTRAPTVAELERETDYAAMEVLPPLPDVPPIDNARAYKGYMKLKYAWSERRTPVVAPPPVVADQHFEDAAENLVDDIFDASMELRTVHSEEIDITRFSEEYEIDE